jgi:V8-like Glu-specific endopeptidase
VKKFLIALAFVAGSFVSSLGLASSVSDVEKSVFLLYAKDMQGSMRFNCTATAIGNHEFLTASHCVTEERDHKLVPMAATFYLSNDGEEDTTYTKAELVCFGSQDDGFDFAILRSKIEAPAIHIGDERQSAEGDDVFNYSGAAGLGKQFFKGYISKVSIDRALVDRDAHINWNGFMGLVLHAAGGASGSAIINTKGEIIGVLIGTMRDLTVACPASRIPEFRKRAAEAAAKK